MLLTVCHVSVPFATGNVRRVETFVPCAVPRCVVCSRQTERFLPPPERMSWPRPVSGSFFRSGCTGHKKDPISFEAGLAPSSAPAALYPLPCSILLAVETKQFHPVAPAIKKERILFEAGLAPSSASISSCRVLTTDSKKSTLPRQSALRLGCSVLAGWCRIRQPSSPWPALRAPCCPRRRGQWQG